jgi:hypothetical protein
MYRNRRQRSVEGICNPDSDEIARVMGNAPGSCIETTLGNVCVADRQTMEFEMRKNEIIGSHFFGAPHIEILPRPVFGETFSVRKKPKIL